jgi:poly-beta-1,6-N-acetyl-D-glucosamine synthase
LSAARPHPEARLLIVSPVRNEAAHIEQTIRSVAAQTRPPDLWLVADDGSDDGTLELLRKHESELPFMQVVTIEPSSASGRDRLALALEARAFNLALEQVDWRSFTHIGKIDGDIELPPDYFELMLDRVERDPTLGITGGSVSEPSGIGGAWKIVTAPSYHVHGALKLFTRPCFEAVGGIQERLGWDTIDEVYARMRGFRTERSLDTVVRHHRPSGSADGKLRGRYRHGACAYISRYSLPWVLARSGKMAVVWDPRGLSGLAFFWGYAWYAIRRADRVEDDEFKRFVRREHRQRVRRALRALG